MLVFIVTSGRCGEEDHPIVVRYMTLIHSPSSHRLNTFVFSVGQAAFGILCPDAGSNQMPDQNLRLKEVCT